MKIRPMTTVTYELQIETPEERMVREEFIVSYDSEFYDEDYESTDSLFVNSRFKDMKDRYGSDILLIEFSIEREDQILH